MLEHTYFASYADDNTPCTVNENAEEVTWTFKQIFESLLQWFQDSKIKFDLDKCHLIMGGKENREINVWNVVMKNS